MGDKAIAERLNEEKLKTGQDRAWTSSAVHWVRLTHTSIRRAPNADARRSRLPDRHPDGRYSIRGAMKRFGVNEDKVRRWIKRGMVDATREDFQCCERAWWLSIDEETAKRLEQDAEKRRRPRRQANARVPARR